MTRTRGLETRVIRYFVGLAVLLSLASAGITLLIAYITEDEIIGRILSDEIAYLQQAYDENQPLPEPRPSYMAIYPSAEQAPVAVREALENQPERREIFTPDERHFHIRYLYVSDRDQPLLVAEVSSMLAVTNMSSGLLMLLIATLCVVIAVATAMAYRIARQTTRPIIQLSQQVSQQSPDAPSLSLSSTGREDEVGYLARTIESTFNELQQALQREHHFTRDVSHELRTPLTIMSNALELASHRPVSAEDLTLLRQAVSQMQATVSVLLALAREESLQFETVPLRPLLELCVLNVHDTRNRPDFQVELQVADNCQVEGNRQLITLLATNLLENALQYAALPQLTVQADHSGLRFSNHIAAPLLDDLTAPNQKQRDSQGLGQGLFLVKRIAATLGWQLTTEVEGELFSVCLGFRVGEEKSDISP